MPKEKILIVFNESELVQSEKNYENERIKRIKKKFNELRNRFLKPKIKEIRRNLAEVENKNNLSTQKVKEIEENIYELEKSISKLKKYYDYYDTEYKGRRDLVKSFNLSIEENYYKPIRTKVILMVILNVKVMEIKTIFYQLKNIML